MEVLDQRRRRTGRRRSVSAYRTPPRIRSAPEMMRTAAAIVMVWDWGAVGSRGSERLVLVGELGCWVESGRTARG